MITVKNLSKVYKTPEKTNNYFHDLLFRKYKDTVALDNVSFEIGENELVGFIGPNGAGKTTTLKILSGILYPTAGEVRVLGNIPFNKNKDFLKQISFVMGQRNQLIWDLPAYDTFNLNKEIYEVDDQKFNKIVDELTILLNVKDLVAKPVKTLSLGERMKMELIGALIHQPKLIFFDEPTIGLDIFSQKTIRDFIKKYQKEHRATIILTSHYMEDVKSLANRLIVINQGKILYDGKLKEIIQEYGKERYIKITLNDDNDEKVLPLIGQILYHSFPTVVYKIKKSEIPEKINLINSKISFSDLTIEEEPIEEIIKKLFNRKI